MTLYCCVLLILRLKSLKSVVDSSYNLYLLIVTEEWTSSFFAVTIGLYVCSFENTFSLSDDDKAPTSSYLRMLRKASPIFCLIKPVR